MDAPKTHGFMPCNHRCACGPCPERVMQFDKRCLYRREPAESVVRQFFLI